MELDELKLAWQELDARVRHTHALNLQLLRDSKVGQAQHGLRTLRMWDVLQILIGVALSVWGATFWSTHLHWPLLLGCGLFLHAYGILLIVLAAIELYLIAHIDYAAPVLDIQRRVEKLREFRVRVEARIHGTLGWFLWIPVTLALLASFGFDVWSSSGKVWIWVLLCTAVGVIGVVATWTGVARMRRKGFARRFDDASVGRSVLRAEAALDELVRFERE